MALSIAFSNQLRFASIDRLAEILTTDDTHVIMASGYGYVLPDSVSYGGETDSLADFFYKDPEPIIQIENLSVYKLGKTITAVGFHDGAAYFAAQGYVIVVHTIDMGPQPKQPWHDVVTSLCKIDHLPIGFVTDRRGFWSLDDYLACGYICVNGWVFNPDELLDDVPSSLTTLHRDHKRPVLISAIANVYEVSYIAGQESGFYLDQNGIICCYVYAGKKAWVIEPIGKQETVENEVDVAVENIIPSGIIDDFSELAKDAQLADAEEPTSLKRSVPLWRPGVSGTDVTKDNPLLAINSGVGINNTCEEDVIVDFYVVLPLKQPLTDNQAVLDLYANAKYIGESVRCPGWSRYTVAERYLTDSAVDYFNCVKDPRLV